MEDKRCDCCLDWAWWLIPEDSWDSTTCECSDIMCLEEGTDLHCVSCCRCEQTEIEITEERIP